MIQSKVVPDNVDRMLLQVLDETLTAEPWRTTARFVVISDVSGALSAWSREQKLQVLFVQDWVVLLEEHAFIVGTVDYTAANIVIELRARCIFTIHRCMRA